MSSSERQLRRLLIAEEDHHRDRVAAPDRVVSLGYWIAQCSQGDRRRLSSYPAKTAPKWKPLKVGVILAGASGTPDLLHVVLDRKLWRLSGATWSEVNLKRRGRTNGLWSDGAWLYVVTNRAVLRARTGGTVTTGP